MRFFGKRPPPPPTPTQVSQPAAKPAAGGTDEIVAALLTQTKAAYTAPRPDGVMGIHVETLVSALGAMAGFGCQIALREGYAARGLSAEKALVVAKTTDGGTYYFGNDLNLPLLEAKPANVWTLVAGGVERAGRPLPDITKIVAFVASSIGSSAFGTTRVAPEHQPHEAPIEALRRHWPEVYATLVRMNYSPMFTGWYFATAIQHLIVEARDVLDASIAGQIAMEAAVAMAKIDPRLIGVVVRA